MNDEQKGVLGELINIAFGAATALIASLFDSFATLRVPKIDMVPIGDVNKIIRNEGGGTNFFLTSQQIKGGFSGEIVLVVDEKSAQNMQLVIGEGEDVDENSQQQNILEIANILGTSCMGKFAELLEAEIGFTPPSIVHTDRIVNDLTELPYHMVIMISTVLEFNELDIQGNLIIMFRNDMYIRLAEALDSFVKNL